MGCLFGVVYVYIMLTVWNALLMSSATLIVRACGLFLFKPVAMVLFMLCSACSVIVLKPCCVEMLFLMYGRSVFSSIFAITKRSEMGLYDVPMFMSLFGFGMCLLVSMCEGLCCCLVMCCTRW